MPVNNTTKSKVVMLISYLLILLLILLITGSEQHLPDVMYAFLAHPKIFLIASYSSRLSLVQPSLFLISIPHCTCLSA